MLYDCWSKQGYLYCSSFWYRDSLQSWSDIIFSGLTPSMGSFSRILFNNLLCSSKIGLADESKASKLAILCLVLTNPRFVNCWLTFIQKSWNWKILSVSERVFLWSTWFDLEMEDYAQEVNTLGAGLAEVVPTGSEKSGLSLLPWRFVLQSLYLLLASLNWEEIYLWR